MYRSEIELRHLRYFVAVSEELHFGRAAARLHMSQPPLSQQIRSLEAELGLSLLRRTNRRVELTSAGTAFLEGARRTLESANQAVREARSADDGETGELVLGFVDSSIYGYMPAVLRAFRKQHPSVRVNIRALASAEQVEKLERGEIQVGILRPLRVSSRLVIEELGREHLVVALPKGHRLASRKQLRIADLKDESLVFFKREFAPAVYDRIMGMFHRDGQLPHIAQEAGEQHTIIGLVAAGLGYSITAEGMREWGTEGVVYRPLAHPSAWVPMGVAWRRADRSDPVRWFVETARDLGASTRKRKVAARA
ncbi:MAG TPA: LysR substrate-binding domain-containing protein [Candidatus Dormibacteraeota bacterium]|nr:LysR substrate-binding domain-containing protein [Candidatus Dormibacteraeota bacterium]